MNEQIMKILPEKVRCHKELMVGCGGCIRNLTIDDCAAAIEKANLVVCPTEKEILDCISAVCQCSSCVTCRESAKALLALLRGEK